MSSRSYTKRNRPVTACRECVRRKQKCDRLKPCNMCLVRNVPEKCLYGDDVMKRVRASNQKEQAAPLTPPSDHESTPDYEPDPSVSNIDEQIGYSAFSDNAFIDLNNSIDAVQIPTKGILGPSVVPLRPVFKDRYFKIVSQLPSVPLCQSLVDIYMNEADWYFNNLDGYYFQRLHAAWNASSLPDESFIRLEQYPRDLQHFPALLFQVLAVALQFLPTDSAVRTSLNITDRIACDKQSQVFSDFGAEIMNILERHAPSIAGIEHDIVRLTWLKNCSRGSEAWFSLGNAVRQAQDLELHLELDISSDDVHALPEQLWYDEYKRRVWARVFFLDAHMAVVLGRPRHIHLDDCTVEWPVDCDVPDNPATARPAPPGLGQVPSSFTFVIFLQQIGVMIHEVMSAKAKKAHLRDYSKVERAHRDVEDILDSLPPAMRPRNPDTSWDQRKPQFPKKREQMITSANSFLMKLHRPFININENSYNAVINAALATLDAQQRLYELMRTSTNQHRIYSFSFYTIDAGIMLSAVVLSRCPQDPELIEHINKSLREAIIRLGLLRDISQVAASGEQLLMQCYTKINENRSVFRMDLQEDHSPSLTPEYLMNSNQFNYLDHYNLSDPQNLELGALPDLYESDKLFTEDNMNLMSIPFGTIELQGSEFLV